MDLQRDLWPCDDRWDHCALSMAWETQKLKLICCQHDEY